MVSMALAAQGPQIMPKYPDTNRRWLVPGSPQKLHKLATLIISLHAKTRGWFLGFDIHIIPFNAPPPFHHPSRPAAHGLSPGGIY